MSFSYSLADFVMFSSQVYGELFRDYSSAQLIVHLLVVVIQVGLLIWGVRFESSKSTVLARGLFITHALEWGLLAAVFYPYHFATIGWYWPWLTGLCSLQTILLLFYSFKLGDCHPGKIQLALFLTLACVPTQSLAFPAQAESWAVVELSPLRAALVGGVVGTLPGLSALQKAFLLVFPTLIVGHEFLVLIG